MKALQAWIAVLVVGLSGLLLGGCVTAASPGEPGSLALSPSAHSTAIATVTPSPTQAPRATPYEASVFWAGVAPGGMNDEHYGSLDAMTRAADAVVVGKATRISRDSSRHVELKPEDGAFAQLELQVEQTISGTAQFFSPNIVIVELFMSDPDQYESFAAGVPDEEVMLFLRNKAVEARTNGWPEEGPDTGHLYYRVVSDQGVIRDVNGKAVAPDDEGGFLTSVRKMLFSDVIAAVKAAAKG